MLRLESLLRDLKLALEHSPSAESMKMLQSLPSKHVLKVLNKAKAEALSKNKDALTDVKAKIATATARRRHVRAPATDCAGFLALVLEGSFRFSFISIQTLLQSLQLLLTSPQVL